MTVNKDTCGKETFDKDTFWNDRRTIVAAFDSRWHADQAIEDLREAGFRDEGLGVTPDQPDRPAFKGLDQTLVELGVPRNEALCYEREFQKGATLVTVTAAANKDKACEILRRHGGFERKMDFGPATSAPAAHAAASHTAASHTAASHKAPLHTDSALREGEQETAAPSIQLRAEELQVRKNRQQAGEVTLKKEVHTEHKTIDVPVEREEVVIERRPAKGHVPASKEPLKEGETIRVPVSEEHVEVIKTPVVTEEVAIGKKKVKDTKRVSADVSKEELKVERPAGTPKTRTP
jgi:uncharacterized protein (TIGR02271 family)